MFHQIDTCPRCCRINFLCSAKLFLNGNIYVCFIRQTCAQDVTGWQTRLRTNHAWNPRTINTRVHTGTAYPIPCSKIQKLYTASETPNFPTALASWWGHFNLASSSQLNISTESASCRSLSYGLGDHWCVVNHWLDNWVCFGPAWWFLNYNKSQGWSYPWQRKSENSNFMFFQKARKVLIVAQKKNKTKSFTEKTMTTG